MDIATIGVLGGMMTIMLTIVLYLDRSRRAEMAVGFKQVNDRLDRLTDRLDRLTATVLDLAKTVGEVKGRLDALAPAEVLPVSE